jgi:hypothetical protein
MLKRGEWAVECILRLSRQYSSKACKIQKVTKDGPDEVPQICVSFQ